MKILITGGAGYIGSHFVKASLKMGHHPVIVDNLSTGHEWAVLGKSFYQLDISDKSALTRLLKDEAIEAVVHFASDISVGESFENPLKYFKNNYANTLGLLEAMVSCGVRYFVFSSSAAVYGVPEKVPISENTPKNPINPYGLSKHFVEETLKWFDIAYGLKYVCLRYFNAAGGDPGLETGELHEPETHLIPRILEAAAGLRDHIEIFGTDYDTPDGTCIRDYIHVHDLASAHIHAMTHLLDREESRIFNLGNNKGYSVKMIIDVAKDITGKNITALSGPKREGDPAVLIADSALARKELSWQPQYEDISIIIEHAWQWMQKALKAGYYGPSNA